MISLIPSFLPSSPTLLFLLLQLQLQHYAIYLCHGIVDAGSGVLLSQWGPPFARGWGLCCSSSFFSNTLVGETSVCTINTTVQNISLCAYENYLPEKHKGREKDLPSMGSLESCPQQQWLVRPKPGVLNSDWVSSHGLRVPRCLSHCLLPQGVFIHRKMSGKQSSWHWKLALCMESRPPQWD